MADEHQSLDPRWPKMADKVVYIRKSDEENEWELKDAHGNVINRGNRSSCFFKAALTYCYLASLN